jgi:hypothetical protein
MSDEEFDAFLRGEGDLSRRLQGLTQPASSPKLDAAILGYVKAGLAQEAQAAQVQPARPAAANDAVIGGAAPRLARGIGRRWRIPAGIAAGVLAGVLGHQAYQNSAARMEAGMAAAPVAAEVAAPSPPVVVAEAAPAPPVEVATEAARPSAPAPAARAASPAPPLVVAAPPPPEAPPAPVVAAAAPPSQEPGRVDIVGSSIKRAPAEDSTASNVAKPQAPAAAPAPASSAERYSSASPAPERPSVAALEPPERAGIEGKMKAAPSSARAEAPLLRSRALALTEMEKAAESKPETPDARAKRARDWLSVIDAMLKADLKSDALAEWTKFRTAYPDYPVPDEMLARIGAINR